MRLSVRHRTEFRYSLPVSQATSQLCLLPRETPTQSVRSARLEIEPGPESIERGTDRFGNHVARFGLDRRHAQAIVTSTSVVDTADEPAPPAVVPARSAPPARRSARRAVRTC